jgi:REP element-mobilizing transposase RayT
MARPLRLQIAGEFFHILARGNSRQPIFLDDVDRTTFLETLQAVVDGWALRCHAYCLMGNHYHLLLQPSEPTISRALRQLNGVYAQSFNRRHDRVGHVFAGRFKSLLVDRDNYLVQVTKYLALNPVRAGLVTNPEAWPWSHYRSMAGIAPPIPFLTRDEILRCFDARNRTAAQEAYREFVALDSNDDERIRTAIARGGILGNQALTARVSSALDAFASEPEIPRCERLAHRPPLESLFTSPSDRGTRDQRIREAYEIHRYTIGQIAAHLRMGRSTISRALRCPELTLAREL